ncbi:translocation/assembly module TamB domain-containing protein [Fundidesulfovibrio putealis]|uniref:translocation/assembly module TamB domain-containing protein n=1 Tax=Fundidesulfovibrio putealis TaxID=270496 RepID=UPI00047FDD0E|nr:translocation/assembly module TamB domain-containing protein [Fundidesulfovibrio putealis]
MGIKLSRTALLRAGKWAAWLSAVCLVIVLAAYLVVQTPWTKGLLVDAIVDSFARELGWKVELSTPEGMLPFTVRIASLRISDKDGEWLAATNTSLSISPWPFGRGLASVRLAVDEAALRRAPLLPPDQGPPPPASRPLAFLDSLGPIPVEAEVQADIASLILDAPVAGRAMAGRASVHALALAGAVDARISVTAHEGAKAPDADAAPVLTDVSLEARIDPGARTARLKLALTEGAGGLAAAMAGLSPDLPLSLTLDGDGPLSGWQAKFAMGAGQDEMLSGTLTAELGRTSANDAKVGLSLSVNPFFLPVSPQLRDALGSRVELAFAGLMTSAGLPEPQWRVLAQDLSVSTKAFKALVRGDSGPMGLAPRLTFELSVADPGSLGVKTGPLAVHGGLDADIDPAGPLTAALRLSSPDLASALSPLGVELGGKADIAAKLTGDVRAQDFSVTLDAGLTELASGASATGDLGPKLATALGREVSLRLDASLSGGKLATLKGLRLTSKALRVDASGSYDIAARSTDARAEVDAPDLSALAPFAGMKLAGSVTLRARAEGIVDAPRLTLDVEGKTLTLDQTRLDRAGLRLAATPEKGGVAGRLEVRAEKGKGSLSVSTAFAQAGQKLVLTGLQGTGPGLALSGDLDAALDHMTATGRVKASVDLAPLGAFLSTKMAGRMQAEVSLASSGPRQDVTARVEASGLSAEGAGVKKADVSGSFTDVLRSPQGALTVALAQVTAGSAALESVQLKANAGGKAIEFSVALKGTRPESFELATGGSFAPAPGGGTLRLDKLDATAREMKLILTRPATAAFAPGVMSLEGLNLSLDGTSITASGALRPGKAEFSADVAALPLGMLEKAGLPALSGTATLALRVSGTPTAPRVTAEVKLDQVAVRAAQGQNIAPANLTAEVLLAGGRLTVSARASAGTGAAFDLKAALPARLSLSPFAFALPRDAALEAALTGDVDLAQVAAMTGDEALSLKGTLKADFTVSGKLSAPLVSGRATLSGGQADYVATGTRLRDITLDLEASGTRATLKTFSARDAGQGSLTVSGKADLSPEAGFPFEGALVVDKLTPVRMDMVTAMLSAKVDVSGGAGGAKVKGGVNVGPVEVAIPNRVPPDATPIQVTMVGPRGSTPAKPAPPAAAYPVDLDVAVDFPGRIFVRGMGLDSMWAGNLRVKGTAAQPEIGGAIRIVKGQLDFFGKNFNLARGEVTFYGSTPPMPVLDIEAKAEAGDITASILVSGSAARPSIDFTSDPAVPRDEILARVLFGQSVSSLTPPQALQLAQAVATLSGAGGSLDFLGATRKLAGLDYLGVKSTGQNIGQSTVAAGKYVADGVYVEASQGLAGTSGAVSVEVDVTKNITIESKIGLDAKTGVGLNWKFDY